MDINAKKVILIYEDETIMEWARYLPEEGKYERHNDILNRIQHSVPDVHNAVIIFEFHRNHENTIFVPTVTYPYQKETLVMVMPFEDEMRYTVYVEKEDGTYQDYDTADQLANYTAMIETIEERMTRKRG